MTLLWLASRLFLRLALLALKLAVYLSPAASFLAKLTAILLVVSMTTQALEHGVLASIYSFKWNKKLQHGDLRRDFYRVYWLVTLLYVLCSSLWIYSSKRTEARVIYGYAFCALWWVLQLVIVLALAPVDQILDKIKVAKLSVESTKRDSESLQVAA